MNAAKEVLTQDLQILEAMLAEMEDYLSSDATHWPMHREGMPKLTIGGCLMRLSRLNALRASLADAEKTRLNAVQSAFDSLLGENVVRFEARAHDELHARLREWTSYLRNATSQMAREQKYYAGVVDTRVVITALIDKLQAPPFQLSPQVAEDVTRMDNYLKGMWQAGEFVMPEVWQEAYPSQKYWWLYGCPRLS